MSSARFFLAAAVCFLASCAMPGPQILEGHLGESVSRRVVVAGENIKPEIAQYYEKEYQAQVWYTPFRGKVANTTDNLWESGIGPSRGMRSLIGELKSINHTFGRWEIIVPKLAEKYFFKTLKSMPTSSLSKARGLIFLPESQGFPELEREAERVSGGGFFVTYGEEKK